MKNLEKYLQEISVVVIGVAITLSVSYWISRQSEKKDVALYELKKEQCIKENQLELEGNPPSIPLYGFFVTYVNFGALEGSKRMSLELKEMILKLEKSKK
ncbi:MAG: hypothetical protein FWG84_09415 [Bacteroidales bacterium]|nr:hypothetical protein [Bacteroidales bacterium]